MRLGGEFTGTPEGRCPPEPSAGGPLCGYKLAHLLLSRDGTRAGFTGVSVGGALPYGVLADARCAYGRRHPRPAPRCDCGFHALHSRADALALTRAGAHRCTALLEVTALGGRIRYARGMRYARQRVRSVHVGPCDCGLPPGVFVDAGRGRAGCRALTGACARCATGRDTVGFGTFAQLAGGGLRVIAGHGRADGSGAPSGTAGACWHVRVR
ncbi:hypothetical protein [Streptomyces pinistramenti]|uniref:hypothetical protein n=1 Tax=Streptomyces pinistramenti TaxID=2884812 RepID=UPI001D079E7D|nr:hypothetical protein [Streptomyces pinistramenti]MCB5907269.1 hypothetical protein [Streptomyces pinistramenti]